ncbi:MAG: hypothetical protein FWE71_09525 [Nocardioidaceae bacterium]|nr:hypothetical protein [Nocardioidaceae bacterium]MCL2612818.1 hypothetical protein [Nocardioidaceae bacterium]
MTRRRIRTILLVVGVLPAIAAVLFAAMVARMLLVQHSGDSAYDDGHFLDAAGHYRSAGHLDPFENWIAAFDAGAARHADGQYAVAVRAYQAALAFGVPHRDSCTVRINLSLADEAIGDKAEKAGHANAADDAYQAGITALEDGRCPTDSGHGPHQTKDAKRVDKRLHDKIKHNQQQKQRQQQKKKRQQQKKRSESKKQRQQDKKREQHKRQQQQQEQQRKRKQQQKRERLLQQQNQQGAQQRKSQQNLDQGWGYTPNW